MGQVVVCLAWTSVQKQILGDAARRKTILGAFLRVVDKSRGMIFLDVSHGRSVQRPIVWDVSHGRSVQRPIVWDVSHGRSVRRPIVWDVSHGRPVQRPIVWDVSHERPGLKGAGGGGTLYHECG